MSQAFIVGLGPVSLATARLLERNGLGFRFLARYSDRSEQRASRLENGGVPFRVMVEKPELASWSGIVRGSVSFFDSTLETGLCHDPTSLLFLAVPHTAYEEVIHALDLASFEGGIVLLSPGLGASARIESLLGHSRVFTLANFWGAAKYHDSEVVLKAIKKRVYAGTDDPALGLRLRDLFRHTEIEITSLSSSLAAEFRNITLYVHPVFTFAPITFRASLGLDSVPKYLYKLFPEGPIERRRTKLYAAFTEEVMNLAAGLGIPRFNFLSFLHRDNYSVPSCFLEEEEVDQFPDLDSDRQGDLIYARYSGLLVDALSQPDRDGRYFDFSAVPVSRVDFDKEDNPAPRIISEDLFHLLLLCRLAQALAMDTPALENLVGDYQDTIRQLSASKAKTWARFRGVIEEQVETRAAALLGKKQSIAS
jgi:staphylopine/pseudopaline/yersinopine synthase